MSSVKLKVTSVSVSKKGKLWIQAEQIEGEKVRPDDVLEFEVVEVIKVEEGEDDT